MAGIVSYGAYIPIWRIDRGLIASMTPMGSLGGERSFCARDEDSISMAVEAGVDCLRGINPKGIDGVYFASVSSPFRQKQAAGIIAAALDMRRDAFTFDFGSSTRAMAQAVKAATDAVKAGSVKKVLVVGAEHRVARPGSQYEQLFGDGAAALLIGDAGIIAEIEAFKTIYDPILGPWQTQDDKYLRTYEARVDKLSITLGDVPSVVKSLLKEHNLGSRDIAKFAIAGSDVRSYQEMAKAIGFDPNVQMDDPLISTVGVTGTPHSILLLVSAIEKANPGERIVCVSEDDGAEAFLVKTTGEIEAAKGKHRGTHYLASKKAVKSYGTFAEWQGTRDVA